MQDFRQIARASRLQSRRQSRTGRFLSELPTELVHRRRRSPSPGRREGNDIVPLVGARRRDRLPEALGALDVKLTDARLAALGKAFPPGVAAGARYPEAQLAHMDSEKRPERE